MPINGPFIHIEFFVRLKVVAEASGRLGGRLGPALSLVCRLRQDQTWHLRHLSPHERRIVDPLPAKRSRLRLVLVLLVLVAAQDAATLDRNAEVLVVVHFWLRLELSENQDAVVNKGLREHGLGCVLELLRKVKADGVFNVLIQRALALCLCFARKRSCAFQFLDEDKNVMLTDEVLFALRQKLEVEFEVTWHEPLLRDVALLEEVRREALVELWKLHGIQLPELLSKDGQNLVRDRSLKLLDECLAKVFATEPQQHDLLVNRGVPVLGQLELMQE